MNFFSKTKIAKFKKFVIVILLMFSLVFGPIQAQQAQAAWGEFPQQIFKTVLEFIKSNIMSIVISALKVAAIKAINQEMNSIIGGSFSQAPAFITNWKDYLHDKPREAADKYMNDYLSQTITAGRASASGYVKKIGSNLFSANYEGVGNGSFNYGLAMNNSSFGKFSYVAQAASVDATGQSAVNPVAYKQLAADRTTEKKQPSLDDCKGDLADARGNFANLRRHAQGICSQWAFAANAEDVYQEKLTEEKQTASAESVAGGGFTGTKSKDGQTISPGILVKDAMANVQNIGSTMLATARDAKEIATSMVQQLITSAIQKGIGKAAEVAQKKVQDTRNKTMKSVNERAREQGVGSMFRSN